MGLHRLVCLILFISPPTCPPFVRPLAPGLPTTPPSGHVCLFNPADVDDNESLEGPGAQPGGLGPWALGSHPGVCLGLGSVIPMPVPEQPPG